MTTTQSQERLHALDAVRGFALTLGIVFHATMSFLPGPQVWVVHDNSTTPVLGVLFFTLHIFRMSVFFLIAGYFGRLMVERRGMVGFLRDRGRRIALPLVVAWFPVMALIVVVSIWAAYQAAGGRMPSQPPQPAHTPFGSFPLTHLWFLWVLLWFYGAALVIRAVAGRLGGLMGPVDAVVRFLATNPVAPVLLAIPFTAAIAVTPMWMLWFGIPTPDMNLIINLPAAAAYGTAFAFGWLLHRQPQLMPTWTGRWVLNLSVAVAATIGLLVYAGTQPVITPAPRNWQTLAFAATYALATWTWTFGLIGAALQFLSGESRWRRYLADSSYWLYIVHIPLVMALQTVAAPLGAPWWIKFPVILVVAFALMLASYQLMVRYTFIGATLNGRRFAKPGRQLREAAPQQPAAAGG